MFVHFGTSSSRLVGLWLNVSKVFQNPLHLYKSSDLSMYQFVFIDGVTKLGSKPADFELLEKKHPYISFIYVHQVTKGGKCRGDNDFLHDIDIVIEVPEKGLAIQNGRYNQGGKMKIFDENGAENDLKTSGYY